MHKLDTSDKEIHTSRLYNASRERVFDAWTDPAHITHWWGPQGFTTTTKSMDLRPGGEWLFVMHGPDGRDYENRVVYREVVRPERLAYRHTGVGNDDPIRFEATVDFIARGDCTEVIFQLVLDTREMYEEATQFGAVEGLHDTMDRFAAHLAKMT